MIYIAADHGGYELKEKIKEYLSGKQIPLEDCGAFSYNKDDDYPDFALTAAHKVAEDPDKNIGILICRSGQGVNIAANKIKGIRAALVWNEKEAHASRTDDLANIISLPSDYIDEETAKKSVSVFLETPWSDTGRHVRRIKKILAIES